MRTSSRTGSVEKNFWKIACAMTCILLFLSGCMMGVMHKRSTHKKPAPAKVEHERAPETGAKKEIIRTESKPITLAATPKAKASSILLENGRRELAQENFEAAEHLFQEAINIDPANGIAYYYLAKAKYKQGQFEQANGVLDKAEGLLAESKEWMEAISILRDMISHEAN